MRILVTGSRNWTDECAVYEALKRAQGALRGEEITVVHGDCPTGADFLADRIARLILGMSVEKHPADWARYGRAAGPIRNAEMVDLGADTCLAFPEENSRGTFNCMKLASTAGIPVINYGYKK